MRLCNLLQPSFALLLIDDLPAIFDDKLAFLDVFQSHQAPANLALKWLAFDVLALAKTLIFALIPSWTVLGVTLDKADAVKACLVGTRIFSFVDAVTSNHDNIRVAITVALRSGISVGLGNRTRQLDNNNQ